MAIIFEFPTDRQRARAAIEATMKNLLDNVGDLHVDVKVQMKQMVMDSYDKYSDWAIQGSVVPPNGQPFTDEQISAIQSGMQSLGDQFIELNRRMFFDILTLKTELFKLTGF